MAQVDNAPKSFWEKMQSLDRRILYLFLMIVMSISVFASNVTKIQVPNEPSQAGIDFFTKVMSIPEGSTILLESDFTLSTRGESAGQLEALLRILMRRNIKFALFSMADPQAPQVGRNIIEAINKEREANGETRYVRWNDWVYVGYFPNAEGTAKSMATDLRNAWQGRRDTPPEGSPRNVFDSPVLQNVRTINDVSLYVIVTGSKTSDIVIERLTFPTVEYGGLQYRTRLGAMVTGVMGPETLNYYKAEQLFGVVVGLNGVVEIETLMENGYEGATRGGTAQITGFKGQKNFARGMAYYFALHMGLALLILAIIIGNIGVLATRKKGAR